MISRQLAQSMGCDVLSPLRQEAILTADRPIVAPVVATA